MMTHSLGSARDDRGFTLVEALITMVITGMLASALLSLIMAQSRFYHRTDDQISAESQAPFQPGQESPDSRSTAGREA